MSVSLSSRPLSGRQSEILAASAGQSEAVGAAKAGVSKARVRHIRQRATALQLVVEKTAMEEAKPLLERQIEWTSLSTRTRRALLRAGFKTVAEIVECSIASFLRHPNVGVKAAKEVGAYIAPDFWIGSGSTPLRTQPIAGAR